MWCRAQFHPSNVREDPGISQLRYDPSADELTCQNDLMSDPSADRWVNIFYHVRSQMRTSCTRLDQGLISHVDGFFLAGTWSVVLLLCIVKVTQNFDHNHSYINCMAYQHLNSPYSASCSTAHDIGVGIL